MEHSDGAAESAQETLDRFALDLQRLRETEGVSYTELANRVSQLRLDRGLHEAAARTPRSTVYTCFRTGRARINTDLLRDIVLALGRDEEEAERWVSDYREARRRSDALRRSSADARGAAADLESAQPSKLNWQTIVLVLVAAVLINRLGRFASIYFHLGIFFDMIGTCIAALVLGPWFGIAIAASSLVIALISQAGPASLFCLVNITGALVWGFGGRRFKMGDDLSRFTLLGIITAVSCSAVGVPINMFLTSIGTDPGQLTAIQALESLGHSYETALLSVNLTTSIIDKLLASFIALVVFTFLHRRYDFPAGHMPLVERLGTLRAAQVFGHAPRMI